MEDMKKLEKYIDKQIMKNFFTVVLGGAIEFELDADKSVVESIKKLYVKEGWYIHETENKTIRMRSKAAKGVK